MRDIYSYKHRAHLLSQMEKGDVRVKSHFWLHIYIYKLQMNETSANSSPFVNFLSFQITNRNEFLCISFQKLPNELFIGYIYIYIQGSLNVTQ